MYALEDPGTEALIVGPDKSNLGAKGVAHWFAKTPVKHFAATTNSDATVALLESIGDDHRSIREVLAEQADTAKPARKTNLIDLWLSEILSDGPVPSAEPSDMASAKGYSQDQLRGASNKLGVKANQAR